MTFKTSYYPHLKAIKAEMRVITSLTVDKKKC